jgi:hypothetical protein
MEKRAELRLCRLRPAGRVVDVVASVLSLLGPGVDAAGREAEWECEDFCGGGLVSGLAGLDISVSGSSPWHISQEVRSGWLRKVHRGQGFFCGGDAGLSSDD